VLDDDGRVKDAGEDIGWNLRNGAHVGLKRDVRMIAFHGM
jgi:hypothetical protein